MQIHITKDAQDCGRQAAEKGLEYIREALREKGSAAIILATGTSQFEMLTVLTKASLDWSNVEVFHLDEYVGISSTHKASFRNYLKKRVEGGIQGRFKDFHYIRGDRKDLSEELGTLNERLAGTDIDAAFVGIGENGHLAFNDPPADFITETPYIVVSLDEACRTQQVNEGWFADLSEVPEQAVSMSIRQIMKSRHIICTVPGRRKAQAVSATLSGPITPEIPASVLQEHRNTCLFLDFDSAALLDSKKDA